MSELVRAILLGLVEGVTEFLPVSSTGHLIVVGHLVGFAGPTADTFDVAIQLGAILAVVVHYRRRLLALATFAPSPGFAGIRGLALMTVTTLPALLVGALAHDVIKARLFAPAMVAIGLGVGGLSILVVERFRPVARHHGLDALRWPAALIVGLAQCLALWPGVSRSAATIVGGMIAGLGRTTAAEYSFLAAIPVITAASLFDLYQSRELLVLADVPIFAVGFVAAFGSGRLALRLFLQLLATSTLKPFGWYRITLALLVAILLDRCP